MNEEDNGIGIDNENDEEQLICDRINYNKDDNNVIIDFKPKPISQSLNSNNTNKNTKLRLSHIDLDPNADGDGNWNDRCITQLEKNPNRLHKKIFNSNPYKTKPSAKSFKSNKSNHENNQSIHRNSYKSERLKADAHAHANVNNDNLIESKSVQYTYNPNPSSKIEVKDNSIVKTENGYEIYFVDNSATNKEDNTIQENINTQELISQNYGLKEAMKNNEETYNSFEKEFMFNTNNNKNNLLNINGDNNNQLLLNLSSNNEDNENYFFTNISQQNNILDENSICPNNNQDLNKNNNINNHIIINFNNYNYQFSSIDIDNSNVKRYNSNNPLLEDLSLYSRQNSKLIKKKIFQNNPACNVSNRLVNDEYNILNKSHLVNNTNCFNCKFIDNVKENAEENRRRKIKTMIPLSQFLLLKSNIMLNIIHFAYDDIEEIKNSYDCIKNKINATLTSHYYTIVDQFNKAYSKDLELYEYYFNTNQKRFTSDSTSKVSSSIFNHKHNALKTKQMKYVSLDLHIKAKIISSQINRTYSISLIFNDIKQTETNEEMILTWKFSVVNKEDIHFWFASEAEDYEGRIARFSYIQPIILYSTNDFISIKLPILFKDNALNPKSIKWIPIESVPYNNSNSILFEKSVYYNTHASLMRQFDKIRFCELEMLIHLWKSEKALTNRKVVDELRRVFSIGTSDVFSELSFEFDVRRVYIYKVKLKAKKCGVIKRNKYFNFDIVVKEKSCCVANETQCLGLLNSINGQYEMRIGDMTIFYCTEIGG